MSVYLIHNFLVQIYIIDLLQALCKIEFYWKTICMGGILIFQQADQMIQGIENVSTFDHTENIAKKVCPLYALHFDS